MSIIHPLLNKKQNSESLQGSNYKILFFQFQTEPIAIYFYVYYENPRRHIVPRWFSGPELKWGRSNAFGVGGAIRQAIVEPAASFSPRAGYSRVSSNKSSGDACARGTHWSVEVHRSGLSRLVQQIPLGGRAKFSSFLSTASIKSEICGKGF